MHSVITVQVQLNIQIFVVFLMVPTFCREPHMRQYLKKLSARKPVVYTGDLNCGHLDIDIHNPTAKHIPKQSGLTVVERAAFDQMLQETQFRDAFRHFHPGTLLFFFCLTTFVSCAAFCLMICSLVSVLSLEKILRWVYFVRKCLYRCERTVHLLVGACR